jgi:hypothetical protein
MNDVLGRRLFLAAVVVCVMAFGLTNGIKLLGVAYSADAESSISSAVQPQTANSVGIDPSTAAQQQLATAASDIANSNTDLAHATADMEATKDQ